MRKLFGWVAAVALGALALFFGWSANRQTRKYVERSEKAHDLEKDKSVSAEKAQAANERAKAALHKANAKLAAGRALAKEAENVDKSVSDRVIAINKRLRSR